jgi:hypothetical protein
MLVLYTILLLDLSATLSYQEIMTIISEIRKQPWR